MHNMRGLLSGLSSESIRCDANAEHEAFGSGPLRISSSLQGVSSGSTNSGSASSYPARLTTAAAESNEMVALTQTLMGLKLEMAELKTATSNRENKLRAAIANLEDRCTRLTTERDRYKAKLQNAVEALSQAKRRIKDTERTNAELCVRLEAADQRWDFTAELKANDGGNTSDYSSSSLDRRASRSLCSLSEEIVGVTTTFEPNDTIPRSTRGRHLARRSRSMGDDDAEWGWGVIRPSIASRSRSWLRQSLDNVFQPGSDCSFKRESWKERTFRFSGALGTPGDDQDDSADLVAMGSEQVEGISFDPKEGTAGTVSQTISASTGVASGISSEDIGSDTACATHNKSLSIENMSWPSQEKRRVFLEKQSRPPSTKNDNEPSLVEMISSENHHLDGDDDNSIQPTIEMLGNDSKNSNSSHDTAKDVDLFFDMFHSKEDVSLGSEDAHYHEQAAKSDVRKVGTITSKGDGKSVLSHHSPEGGKIKLRRLPRRNSCDAQAA